MNKAENNPIKSVLFAVIPLIIVIAIFATAANIGILTNTNSINQQILDQTNYKENMVSKVTATVEIDFGNKTDTFSIESINNTVYGFLLEAAKIGGYDVKATYYGSFDSLLIDSIANIQNGQDNKYWIYYINGESGSVAADKQIVEDDDLIKWSFEEFTY